MRVRTIGLIVSAGMSVLAAAGCGHGTSTSATATPTVTTSPVFLSSAWTGRQNTAPTVAAAHVAPGGWAPSPTPTSGFLKVAGPGPRPSGTIVTTSGACGPGLGPAPSIPVGATPGRTTATITWPDLPDVTVLLYRVGAIPQGWNKGPGTTGTLVQSVAQWQTVAAGHTCKSLTYAFTGLASGTGYEFWVDAVHTTTGYGVPAVTQETMVGRSAAVVVR